MKCIESWNHWHINIIQYSKYQKTSKVWVDSCSGDASSFVDWFVDSILSRLQRQMGSAEGLDLVSKLSLELHCFTYFCNPQNSNWDLMFAQKTVHTDTHLKNNYFLKLFMFANQIVESAKASWAKFLPWAPLHWFSRRRRLWWTKPPRHKQRRAELRAAAARGFGALEGDRIRWDDGMMGWCPVSFPIFLQIFANITIRLRVETLSNV